MVRSAMSNTASPSSPRGARIGLTLVGLLAALHLAWPGDVGFIYDEPNLMRKALDANRAGTLAESGLLGSFGVEYGPVCAWFYQAMIGLSRDLTLAVVVKAALGWSAVVLSLRSIARLAGLSVWPLLLVPASPFAWHFGRTLHDVVFLVPLSAAMFATVAAFLARPRLWLVAAWAGLSALALHVHVIACVPIATGALVVGLFEGRWLARRAPAVGLCLLAAAAVSAPFLWRVLFERQPGNHPHPDLLRSAALAARAFLYSSHLGFEHYVPAYYAAAGWARALALASGAVALAGGTLGLARFASEAWRGRAEPGAWPLDRKLAALAAAWVLGQLALVLGLRLEAYWHYFSGVWLGGFYLIWWGVERAPLARIGRSLLVASAAACALLTLGVAGHVHSHGGDRTPVYGATLANQQALARRIVAERLARVTPQVSNYVLFPIALQVLVELAAGEQGFQPRADARTGVIVYRDPDPASGFIELRIEAAGPAAKPTSNTGASPRR